MPHELYHQRIFQNESTLINQHLERAWVLYDQRRYELAEEQLQLALTSDPDHPGIHALLALCLLERQEHEAATSHAEQALAHAPDDPQMYSILGHVWIRRNFLDKGREVVEEAIRLDPTVPEYHLQLGEVHAKRANWTAGVECAELALKLDPENISALNLRARCLNQLGDKNAASARLQVALQLDPDDHNTHANLGWSYLSQGNRDKALEHFQEALRLNPMSEWARLGLVETIKSRNFFYRMILNYFIKMSTWSAGRQWGVVLGAYFGYLGCLWVLDNHPQFKVVVLPLIVAYIAFVLSSWLARPLSNLLLRLHPLGKIALSDDERRGSNWICGFLLLCGICFGSNWLLPPTQNPPINDDFALIVADTLTFNAGLFFGLMVIPLAAMYQTNELHVRQFLKKYTLVVATMGIIRLGMLSAAFAMDSIEVVQNQLFDLMTTGFVWGALLSMFAGNFAYSREWKD